MNERLGTAAVAAALLAAAIARPGQAETPLERGTYLMQSIVACGNCHTPQGPDGPLPGMELAGGLVIEEEAFTVHTPNITPDPETGIGGWTNAQIKRAITQGVSADDSPLMPPMGFPYYANMTEADLDALVAYLRSIAPLETEPR
jgi:mono/diheme cytochrome c family protein